MGWGLLKSRTATELSRLHRFYWCFTPARDDTCLGQVAVEATVSGLPVFTSSREGAMPPTLRRIGGGSSEGVGDDGDRWRATSWRSAEADRGRVGGRCARRWPAPAGCRRRGGCGCQQTFRITTAGRMACCVRASWSRRPTGPTRRETSAANSVARCRAKRSVSSSGGGASISRPSWATSRPRTDARPCSLNSPSLQRSRTARPVCKTVLHLPGPETVGMIFLQFLAYVGAGDSDRIGAARRGSSDTTPTRRVTSTPSKSAPRTVVASSNPRPGQMA